MTAEELHKRADKWLPALVLSMFAVMVVGTHLQIHWLYKVPILVSLICVTFNVWLTVYVSSQMPWLVRFGYCLVGAGPLAMAIVLFIGSPPWR